MQTRNAAIADLNGKIAQAIEGGDFELAQSLKNQIDALSNSQQMDMLRLQSLSNKRNEAFDVMTSFIKKMQDSDHPSSATCVNLHFLSAPLWSMKGHEV
ncbi:hypothetical protein [Paenibacillus illinoisensis]|uniref:hypothetical protein n=1 Tax=Paenibacillus illinoisensis TaxID=59845 RepID=UPI003D2D596A